MRQVMQRNGSLWVTENKPAYLWWMQEVSSQGSVVDPSLSGTPGASLRGIPAMAWGILQTSSPLTQTQPERSCSLKKVSLQNKKKNLKNVEEKKYIISMLPRILTNKLTKNFHLSSTLQNQHKSSAKTN